jgi:hypothetical protein
MKKKRLEQVFSKKGWEKPGKLNECAVLLSLLHNQKIVLFQF